MAAVSGRRSLPLVRPGSALGSTILFTGGGRAWTVDDAIVDAGDRGALDGVLEETLALAAADELAGREPIEIDEDVLQRKSEKIRYDRDLITAGETEEWLGARGMTLEDFSDWIYRTLCLEVLRQEVRASRVPEDFADQLRIHLWLSGAMDRIAEEFRRRIAAQIELASEKLSRDVAHDRVTRAVLNDEARRKKLDILRIALTRLHIDSLELESEDAAREACLCVREDGERLAGVAKAAGYTIKHEETWLEECTDPAQFSFASDGELVGPIRIVNGFKVCQVVRRVEPSLDDPAIASRIDSALLDESFQELCARHTPLPVRSTSP